MNMLKPVPYSVKALFKRLPISKVNDNYYVLTSDSDILEWEYKDLSKDILLDIKQMYSKDLLEIEKLLKNF